MHLTLVEVFPAISAAAVAWLTIAISDARGLARLEARLAALRAAVVAPKADARAPVSECTRCRSATTARPRLSLQSR
jgi:hypothetical protein